MRANLTLTAPKAQNLTQISLEVLVIHADYIGKIGFEDKTTGNYYWCCSKTLLAAGACVEQDKVILPPESFAPAANENKYKLWDTIFDARPEGGFEAFAAVSYNFSAGGMYARSSLLYGASS